MTMSYELTTVDGGTTVVVRDTVPTADLPGCFGRAAVAVVAALQRAGIEPAGLPVAYDPRRPDDAREVAVPAGVVVVDAPASLGEGEIARSSLPAGRVATAIHVGPYDELGRSSEALMSALAGDGVSLRPIGLWEEYLTDPEEEPDPSTWRTRLVVPVEEG